MFKRGSIFTIMLDFVLIISLVFGFVLMSNSLDLLKNKNLGDNQYDLIHTYQKESIARVQLDYTAKIFAQITLLDLAQRGASNCETFEGYFVLTSDCTVKAAELFQKQMRENHSKLLAQTRTAIFPDFSYSMNNKTLFLAAHNYAQISQIPAFEDLGTQIEIIEFIKKEYGDLITFEHKELLIALIAQESKGDPYAISPTGCIGLTQFCYSTADNFAEFNKLKTCGDCWKTQTCSKFNCESSPAVDDRFNVEKSIGAAQKLVQQNIDQFDGYTDKENLALAAYNAGPALVKKGIEKTGLRDPTWDQVKAVLSEDDFDDLNDYKSFTTQQRINKITEVSNYVARIESYQEVALA